MLIWTAIIQHTVYLNSRITRDRFLLGDSFFFFFLSFFLSVFHSFFLSVCFRLFFVLFFVFSSSFVVVVHFVLSVFCVVCLLVFVCVGLCVCVWGGGVALFCFCFSRLELLLFCVV